MAFSVQFAFNKSALSVVQAAAAAGSTGMSKAFRPEQ